MFNRANERLPFYNFDRMVYSLYGLARDEIAMIEDSLEEKKVNREVADKMELEE